MEEGDEPKIEPTCHPEDKEINKLPFLPRDANKPSLVTMVTAHYGKSCYIAPTSVATNRTNSCSLSPSFD